MLNNAQMQLFYFTICVCVGKFIGFIDVGCCKIMVAPRKYIRWLDLLLELRGGEWDEDAQK